LTNKYTNELCASKSSEIREKSLFKKQVRIL